MGDGPKNLSAMAQSPCLFACLVLYSRHNRLYCTVEIYNIWRVTSEAYACPAGHPFFTDTVFHNGKTVNDRQIIIKQNAAAQVNRHTNLHNKQTKNSTNRSSLCTIRPYIQLLIDRGWSDHVNNIK